MSLPFAVCRELEELVRVARRAAEIVQEVYERGFEVEMKSPGDPVTTADRASHDYLVAELAKSFPGERAVSEEAPLDGDAAAGIVGSGRVFFVDPVDGTRELVDRTGEFSVLVGVAQGGRAVLGAVALPPAREVLAGDVSAGAAFVELAGGERRPISATSTARGHAARLLVSRSHRTPLADEVARALGTSSITPCGSSGVKIARIARGDADLYVHAGAGMKLWDTCAPDAVLHAAGGRVSDLDGRPLDYAGAIHLARGIVASNGHVHDETLSVTATILAARSRA